MTKLLIDCGNCGPDFTSIKTMVQKNFNVEVLQTKGIADTITALQNNDVALVTVNRKLDTDYSDGLEVIKAIKADESVNDVPIMLVTNYDEHQQAAVQAGAVQGFGKLSLNSEATQKLLSNYLQ